jgi:hypothetical protein
MKVLRWVSTLGLAFGLVFTVALAGTVSAADSVTVQLSAQNNSGENGTAELTDMGGGKTHVVLNIPNAPAGVVQPVHIHEGTCANLNPTPKYPLTNLTNGKSDTVVDVSLSDLMSQSFAINAHKSAQDIATYVSCGNILRAAPAAAAGTTTTLPATGGGALAAHGHPSLLPLAIVAGLLACAAGFMVRRRHA